MDTRSLALSTYDLVLQGLPPQSGGEVAKVRSDPVFFSKECTRIMKIRILPEQRQPTCFWNSAWCFYEIGVGSYGIGRANFGGVQFVIFPKNQQCGGNGHYRQGVLDVLRTLVPKGRKGYFLEPFGGSKGAAILCGFHYCLGEFSDFPQKTAARNLIWLISSTLPKFMALR